MIEVVIVVREAGRLKADYSLKFNLPQLPSPGDYISINRPDMRAPLSEDLIVRKVWWLLFHPFTAGFAGEGEYDRAGSVREIFVECDPAVGPYASSSWRRLYEGNPAVERFEVSRARFPDPADE